MKLSTGRIKLNSTMKTLKARWEDIKPGWNDAVCKDFEEQYLAPLEQQVAATVRATDRLSQSLEDAQRQLVDE
jgi:uncharacterized protein YukE